MAKAITGPIAANHLKKCVVCFGSVSPLLGAHFQSDKHAAETHELNLKQKRNYRTHSDTEEEKAELEETRTMRKWTWPRTTAGGADHALSLYTNPPLCH